MVATMIVKVTATSTSIITVIVPVPVTTALQKKQQFLKNKKRQCKYIKKNITRNSDSDSKSGNVSDNDKEE